MLRGGGFHHDVDHLRVSQIGTVLLEGQTKLIDVANPVSEGANSRFATPPGWAFLRSLSDGHYHVRYLSKSAVHIGLYH